jgi:signal transduction histidine kinase
MLAAGNLIAVEAVAQKAQYGSREEARAMLDKAVAAVNADKDKALAMFNKGEGGFKDRDLQPFCWDAKTGKTVASTVPGNVGKNQCDFKDKTGKEFGKELCAAAVEGKVIEVSYMFPRPGSDVPVPKVSFATGVSGLGCAVGYYKD